MDAIIRHTETDFERLSWHDCHVWRLEVRAGNPEGRDWTSDLALDLDYIVEWRCGLSGGGQFLVAPATLVFHGVTALTVAIDWSRAGSSVALHEMSIDHIDRERQRPQTVHLDRPYYRWTIRLNWPESGTISLGALGFTQTLLAEPVLLDRQSLSRRERRELLDGRRSWDAEQ